MCYQLDCSKRTAERPKAVSPPAKVVMSITNMTPHKSSKNIDDIANITLMDSNTVSSNIIISPIFFLPINIPQIPRIEAYT